MMKRKAANCDLPDTYDRSENERKHLRIRWMHDICVRPMYHVAAMDEKTTMVAACVRVVNKCFR